MDVFLALLAKGGLFKKASQVAYVCVCVWRSFVFLGEIWDWVPRETCAELSCSMALRKCVFFYIKLEIAPKLHTLLIYHEIEQLDHQGYHLAHPFHVMKFAVRKSRIQKEKTGCCGQGEKTQFKLLVNSCWVRSWSGNKAEALPLAFTFVALSLDVHFPSRTLFSKADCSSSANSFISELWQSGCKAGILVEKHGNVWYFLQHCFSEHYLFFISFWHWIFFYFLIFLGLIIISLSWVE